MNDATPPSMDDSTRWALILKRVTGEFLDADTANDCASLHVTRQAVEISTDWLSDTIPTTWQGLFGMSVALAALARTGRDNSDTETTRQIHKMAYTILEALEARTGLDRRDYGGAELVTPELDPRGASAWNS